MALKPVDSKRNPGLAKLPTKVRNKMGYMKKGGKVRKFQDGGIADENFTSEQLEFLGGADRTDPYILARMRRVAPDRPKTTATDMPNKFSGELLDETGRASSIRRSEETGELYDTQKYDSVKPTINTTPTKTPVKTLTPAPVMPQEEKDRLAKLEKKQALENVSPEDYIPGVGMVKGILKKGLTRLMKPRMKTYSMSEFEAMTPKLGRESLRLGMKKGGSVKKMASGGKVSSASKRADGIAIKGKTRGRMV